MSSDDGFYDRAIALRDEDAEHLMILLQKVRHPCVLSPGVMKSFMRYSVHGLHVIHRRDTGSGLQDALRSLQDHSTSCFDTARVHISFAARGGRRLRTHCSRLSLGRNASSCQNPAQEVLECLSRRQRCTAEGFFKLLIGSPVHVADSPCKIVRTEILIWRQLRHDNILPMLGVTNIRLDATKIVTPWQLNGSLSDYNKRPEMENMNRLHIVSVF